jgi:hypothetical protein
MTFGTNAIGILIVVVELKKAFPPIERLAGQAKNTADEALRRINNLLQNPPKGLKGEPGKPGKDGRPGKDGNDGISRVFTIPGVPGRNGRDGKDGKNGKDGKDGKNVDERFVKELDRKLGEFPKLIAAIPKPLTYDQTVNAAATGTCRTTQPGGCTSNLVNNAANNINGNLNNKFGDLLNKLSNLANLTLLPIINTTTQTINRTLGSPITNIAGNTIGLTTYVVDSFANVFSSFTRVFQFFKWAVLDRFLNLLIAATTIHNAAMLSNDIGQTLLGSIGNILQLFGIKDSDGQAFNVSEIVGASIENFIKGLIGETNYQQLSEGWSKANRIYQASINILNSFQGLSNAILTGLEMTAGKVAKIGNALRKSGEVLESAYGWMNPQPKFNRITQTLESLQNGASTIQMVTQAPLDIINATTELTTATTELTNALKEDDKPENKGKESPEPDQLKAVEATAKLASAGLELADLDLEADE